MAEADATLTVLARVDAALVGLSDPLDAAMVGNAIKGAALAIVTPPDPHEIVSTTEDPGTGETVIVPPPAPVSDTGEVLVPRDETQDSIDPQTGALTPEAIARRAELAKDQSDLEAADAAVAADKAKLEADQADVERLTGEVGADDAAIAAEGKTDEQAALDLSA